MAALSSRIGKTRIGKTLALITITLGAPIALAQNARGPVLNQQELAERTSGLVVIITGEDVDGRPIRPGLGFSAGPDMLMTDYYLIKDAVKINAQLPEREPVEVRLTGVEPRRLFATLRLTGVNDARVPRGNAGHLKTGDEVYVVMSGGVVERYTIGEIALKKTEPVFRLTAVLADDNRGAPVFNNRGELIGVVITDPNGGGTTNLIAPRDYVSSPGVRPDVPRDPNSADTPGPPRVVYGAAPPDAPREAPERPKMIRKSASVLAGGAIRRAEPWYPPLAKAARIEGSVVVEVTIDEHGDVVAGRALSGHPLLKDSAADAARGWKFKPTMLAGQPVSVIGTITFNFVLGEQKTSESAGAALDTPRVSEVDQKPVLLRSALPRYTPEARKNGTAGSVRMRILVDVDGVVKQVHLVSGLPDGLNEEAIQAANQMVFKPAMKQGQPVEYWMPLEVTFAYK